MFKEGHVFTVYTPEFAPGSVSELAQMLKEDADTTMSTVERFPYCDRNPASAGLEVMPDLPIMLRHRSNALTSVGLVDSGAMISILPYSLGVQLGLVWDERQASNLAWRLPGTHPGARCHSSSERRANCRAFDVRLHGQSPIRLPCC